MLVPTKLGAARQDAGRRILIGGHAQVLGIEGVGPTQPLVTHGSHVLAEEHAHARLTGLQSKEPVAHDDCNDQQRHASQKLWKGGGEPQVIGDCEGLYSPHHEHDSG